MESLKLGRCINGPIPTLDRHKSHPTSAHFDHYLMVIVSTIGVSAYHEMSLSPIASPCAEIFRNLNDLQSVSALRFRNGDRPVRIKQARGRCVWLDKRIIISCGHSPLVALSRGVRFSAGGILWSCLLWLLSPTCGPCEPSISRLWGDKTHDIDYACLFVHVFLHVCLFVHVLVHVSRTTWRVIIHINSYDNNIHIYSIE